MATNRLTLATCFLCMLVFAMELAMGNGLLNASADNLLRFGASTGPLTIGQAEYGRLLSYIFVHANILHLALNLYVLMDFGPTAEASLGRKLYVFVFLFAGVIGALTSIFCHQTQVTVGASAAILGLLGAVIYKSWFEKEQARFSRPQLIMLCIFLFYSLLLGFTSDLIDNAAHLGGFFAGMVVIAAIYGNKPEQAPTTKRITAAASLLPLTIPLLIYADGKKIFDNPDITAYMDHKEAIELIEGHQYEKALAKLNEAQNLALKKNSSILFDRAVALNLLNRNEEALKDSESWIAANKDSAAGLMQKGLILHKLNRNKEAIAALDQAVKPKPFNLMDQFTIVAQKSGSPAILYNNRAWFELSDNEPRQALEDCDKAMALNNKIDTVYDTRGVAYLMLKDYKQAESDFTRAIDLAKIRTAASKSGEEDGAGYYHRAIARKGLGDEKGANEDLERYKSLKYEPETWEPKL
ncbi:MAG: rhomboid family intramembrane serine protease [Cyanobacteria bacterium REEB67]|nr:rhomboid family intramembrane serine protease [Cyanobacteria bacterium REEB67]